MAQSWGARREINGIDHLANDFSHLLTQRAATWFRSITNNFCGIWQYRLPG